MSKPIAAGQPYVLARALGLFATTSKLMIKTVLGRFDDAERTLLAQLLPHLASDDLLIMDRGFQTSEVYGTAQYVPIDEKHPLQPHSASKIGADAMAMSFYNAFGLPGSAESIRPVLNVWQRGLKQCGILPYGTWLEVKKQALY